MHLRTINRLSYKNLSSLLGDRSNLDTASSVEHLLDVTVDQELASSKGTDHDKTSGHTGEETGNTELTSHLDEPRGGRLAGGALGLVDLRQEGVGGLRDNGGGQTSDKTGSKVKTSELSTSKRVLGLASGLEDLLDGDLVDGELGHGIRNLLEEDRAETGVEGSGTFLPQNPKETTGKTVGERWLRDKPDSSGLKGTESNVGEELGDGRGTKVDGLSVLTGLVDTNEVNGLLLPKLVTTELEGTLDGVTDGGGAETSEKSTGTLLGNDLSERGNHTPVVNLWFELDSGLDDINGGEGTVGDGTTKSTRKSESRVEVNTGRRGSSGLLDSLLSVLVLHVGLTAQLLNLGLSILAESLALGNGAVDLVSDGGKEEGVGGGEEGVGPVRRHCCF